MKNWMRKRHGFQFFPPKISLSALAQSGEVPARARTACSGVRLVREGFDSRDLPRIASRRRSMTLNRRELTGYFLTFGLAVPTVGTMAILPSGVAAPGIAATAPGRTVKLHDGTVVPALGQGSARLGQGRHPATVEEDALREGISLGMTLIDTAEMYGNGEAEKLIGRVIAGRREQGFLVSKVWPSHVAGDGIERACEGSLAPWDRPSCHLLAALGRRHPRPAGRRGGF